jgi:hypothetical protein
MTNGDAREAAGTAVIWFVARLPQFVSREPVSRARDSPKVASFLT